MTTNGQNTYTGAMGESMTGVPATTDMKVRNGFVAYMYQTTMLMEFVDQGKISLDDKLSKYLPDLPRANDVTIKMLANSTSGYADFVYQKALVNGIYANPFRKWTGDELIQIGVSRPRDFAPGTNWAYSHTNYLILGSVLVKVGGKPMDQLMEQYIFKPMGLTHTTSSGTPDIPGPVLHTYSSERRVDLEIPTKIPFYEDTTFWDPSWTVPEGASQASDITDLTTSVQAIGDGKLLSPASYAIQMSKDLVGFGHKQAGCSACSTLTANSLWHGHDPARAVDHRQQVLRGQRSRGGLLAEPRRSPSPSSRPTCHRRSTAKATSPMSGRRSPRRSPRRLRRTHPSPASGAQPTTADATCRTVGASSLGVCPFQPPNA